MQKEAEEIIELAEDIQYASKVFPTMYSFAPYPDEKAARPLLPQNPFDVFHFYTTKNNVQGWYICWLKVNNLVPGYYKKTVTKCEAGAVEHPGL